jgi:hypothetical protein
MSQSIEISAAQRDLLRQHMTALEEANAALTFVRERATACLAGVLAGANVTAWADILSIGDGPDGVPRIVFEPAPTVVLVDPEEPHHAQIERELQSSA